MSGFRPVDPKQSFPALEQRGDERWRETDVFHRQLSRRRDAAAPVWSFYEGPPTANGKPGAHHVLSRVAKVGKFIGVGLNYADHAKEAGLPIPSEPIIFMKAITCLSGADDPIMLPKGSKKTDWEVELGVVIGTRARNVSEEDAEKHIAGYCVVNDVSEREFQLENGGTWDKGKGCDTFGPVGPWLVTRDEVWNLDQLDLYLEVNDKRMQTGCTETMIFKVPQLVAYISRFMTLEPGDIIATGTPPGVGLARKRFLKKGDFVRLGIAGLGEQQQDVIGYQEF